MKEEKKTRRLFIGRPCRFKSKKAYDRNKRKQEDRRIKDVYSYANRGRCY